MIGTFQIDLDKIDEVTELIELLERRRAQLQPEIFDLEEETSTISTDQLNPEEQTSTTSTSPNHLNAQENIKHILRFIKYATSNQIQVLKWMKTNPGPVSAHLLKVDLPFLAPHGALSGVFRAGRWVKISGGTKTGFPLNRIDWNSENHCGIYRGLTQEEADAINI